MDDSILNVVNADGDATSTHSMEDYSRNDGMPRLLIAGVGRTGTTLLYQQIAKCFLTQFKNVRFTYEPYLWSLQSPVSKGQPFGIPQLCHDGIQVHQSTPLFLDNEHELHDRFVDKLFGQARNDSGTSPDAFLSKVIRGCGRLRSYIKRYPELKIVASLRNPLETVNSSLGMFSLLGDEFHKPDGERLMAELKDRGCIAGDEASVVSPSLLSYTLHWWRSFTEEILSVAKEYPNNVHLFIHESYIDNPERAVDSLCEFSPLINKEVFQIGSTKHAGPNIKNNHLLAADVGQVYPHLQFYFDSVLQGSLARAQIFEMRDRLLDTVAKSSYCQPVAGDKLGTSTTILLRHKILSGAKPPSRYSEAKEDAANRISVDACVTELCRQKHLSANVEKTYRPSPGSSENSKTFGCVVTCYNNEDTILDSLVSALRQTRPFDKIVVVDDASTDKSVEILEEFAARFQSVEVLALDYNVGVSAARHFGIRHLDTDFITHLDGDDCFWPSKNLHEAEIVLKDENAVAFSDILIVSKNRQHEISTLPYQGCGASLVNKFFTRQDGVPRDMTFARQLYFDVGGYDLRLSLYEDLDFKLRLAANARTNWRKSNAPIGTIYNRKNPSLSRDDGLRLPRALTAHFFRYVDQVGLQGKKAAAAYRELMRNFATDWRCLVYNKLATGSVSSVAHLRNTILSRANTFLDDESYVAEIRRLCDAPSVSPERAQQPLTKIYNRLSLAPADGFERIKSILSRRSGILNGTSKRSWGKSAFRAISTTWTSEYGLSDNEAPFPGFLAQNLQWQTAKSCGFLIETGSDANGIKGSLYIPHVQHQRLVVTVEQNGKVANKTFELEGGQTDKSGNHILQEVEVSIPIQQGKVRVSCAATTHGNESDGARELYCLFADWQLMVNRNTFQQENAKCQNSLS